MLTDELIRFEQTRAAAGYATDGYPRPGATMADLHRLATDFPRDVHPDITEWFTYGDGASGYLNAVYFDGFELIELRGALEWRQLYEDDADPILGHRLAAFIPVLVQGGRAYLVDWDASSPSSVWKFSSMQLDPDLALTEFAPTLEAAVTRWRAELQPPPDWYRS